MTTFDTLAAIYRNVHRIAESQPLPQGATDLLNMISASMDAAKRGGLATWHLERAVAWITDLARDTSSVAVLSYGFITGESVTGGGLDYLVSASGPNPNNLNSDYYKSFSFENRYINFAVSLAKASASNAKFAAGYDALTLSEALKKAYGEIFGTTKSDTEFQAILTPERAAYFASYGGDGLNGLGTKAAMAGWLMAEAVKADLGPYVEAGKNLMRDIAGDGQTFAAPNFLPTWGVSSDHAKGGRADPGLPGNTVMTQHDWIISLNATAIEVSFIRPLATDGNDVITSVTGLDRGLIIGSAGGNDVVSVSGGAMKGHLVLGAGNDTAVIEVFDGQVVTDGGYDTVRINGFGPLHELGAAPATSPLATISDFERGKDALSFGANLGVGAKLAEVTAGNLKDALTLVAAQTAAGRNSVFEWNGSTYVFHQNDKAELDVEDGLVILAGVTGLNVTNGAQMAGDIHFG